MNPPISFKSRSSPEKEAKMDSSKLEGQKVVEQEKKFQPDPEEIAKVKLVLTFLGKAYSSMKIYPPKSPSIKYSFDAFAEKMMEFLNEYEMLLITINEFKLIYEGKTVFQDEKKQTSLPFLFFKDGMREMSFHKGLDENELQEFLETIKADSDLPPENIDIVNSLWVKDFAHIRYFAPDEFLESDISTEEEAADFEIDKTEFSKGKVPLTRQDREDVDRRSVALGLHLSKAKEEGKDDKNNQENIMIPSQIAALSEDETPEIESMLQECRAASRMSEMVNLLFELLFLEERYDQFAATLNVLNQCFKEVVYKFNFDLAALIINRIRELEKTFSEHSEDKTKQLEKILQKARDRSSLSHLKKSFLEGQIENFDSLLQYFKLLGPCTLPFVADIWEISKDPLTRLKASNFLLEMGSRDLPSLVDLAQDNRISLTKEIISLLGRIRGKKIISYLEKFVAHQDKSVRLETIQALRNIEDDAANKILLKFLSDEEPEVRTLAAVSLKYFGDKTALAFVMKLVQKKGFQKRNRMEKKALLLFLAMAQSTEVCAFLRSLLKKWRIFYRTKLNETRLCTVPALEAMATPEALTALRKGSKTRNKTIRHACKIALRKIAYKDESRKS